MNPEISKDISKAAQLLNAEDVVAIPTETVYGLAGNIYSNQAINKIFSLKKRPLTNPLIVHIDTIDRLEEFTKDIPDKALQLAKAFWPGSLTLLLKKKSVVPDVITAGKPTVGVRIPDHPMTLELLSKLAFPLAAPSANPFTSISPTSPIHVKEYFGEELSMVLDGGECKNGIESTIVGFEGDTPVIYRLGSISIEEIENIVGTVSLKNNEEKAPVAPGMMARHYAPKTKTFLVKDVLEFTSKYPNKKIAIITLDNSYSASNIIINKCLSQKGNLQEAASKLYATLHELDTMKIDMIVAQKFPNHGLGKSINDRLSRATK